MPAPIVSIVMPCYRMVRYIPEALEGIGSQTYTAWELVAVEDGVEDGTEALVREFQRKFPENRIQYIKFPENRGVSEARNAGIKAATGEYIAFLDPDDYWTPKSLEVRMQHAGDHLLLSCETTNVDQHGKILFVHRMPEKLKKVSPIRALHHINFLPTSTVIVPRKVFSEVGDFITIPHKRLGEDWDMWIRILETGYELKYLEDERLVRYRVHSEGATDDVLRWAEGLPFMLERYPDSLDMAQGSVELILTLLQQTERKRKRAENTLSHFRASPFLRLMIRIDAAVRMLFGQGENQVRARKEKAQQAPEHGTKHATAKEARARPLPERS